MITPSWKISWKGPIDAGAPPPTSTWWASEATYPISLPSWWTGPKTVTSLRWEPPPNGLFTTSMSPGFRFSAPYASTEVGISSTNDPRWTGWVNACEMGLQSRSKKAQEKSCLVLTFVEYAERLRAAAISSVTWVKADRTTSNWIGSIRLRTSLLATT